MTDLLGPGFRSADGVTNNATTARPADDRVIGGTDTWFKDCTSEHAPDGTAIRDYFLNSLLAQFRQLIRGNGTKADGITPVLAEANDDTETLLAISHLIQRGVPNRALDTGPKNHLSIALSPAPAEIVDGFEINVRAGHTTDAASDLKIGGTTSPIVLRDGSATAGGELVGGIWHRLTFNANLSAWQLMAPAPATAAGPGGGSTATDEELWHFGAPLGGSANALTTTLVKLPADPDGRFNILVKSIDMACGPNARLNFGYGFKAIALPDGSAPLGGEIGPGGYFWFVWDGDDATVVRLQNPRAVSIRQNPLFFHVETIRQLGQGAPGMGPTWSSWPLNTIHENQIPGADLAGDGTITLPAGTYRASFLGQCWNGGQHRCRLYDQTNGVVLGRGVTGDSHSDTASAEGQSTNPSSGLCRFTLDGTTQITLDHKSSDAGTPKFGDDSNDDINIDAYVRIEREIGS